MKQIFFSFIIFYIISSHLIYSQVGIGTKTPNSSSMLDIESTDKGILIPRMTENQKISVLSPVSGLLIYQIDKEIGFYFYDGSIWLRIVKNISPNFTGTINSGAIISTGTISATAFVGDGSGLTGISFNTVSITTNINDIAANTASITTNQGLIASNTSSITTNQGAIAANTVSITSNINDIALKANIANPTFTGTINSGAMISAGSISATSFVGDGSGLTGISFNTVSITTNISDITANTASITTNQGLIASNTSSITTNQGAIAANTVSITSNINDIALKANIANPTFTGTVKATRFELTAATLINASSNTTLDLSSGNVFTISLGTSITNLTITNAVVGTYLIKFVQDGTGGKTVAFPTTDDWKWSGGSAPNVTTTGGKTDIVTLIYDGAIFYAVITQNF